MPSRLDFANPQSIRRALDRIRETVHGWRLQPATHQPDDDDAIGDSWNCWRLRGESDRDYRFRLGVHLQTLAIAIEDDLDAVLHNQEPFDA